MTDTDRARRDAEPAFLAIVGPTASGKTELSLEVARRLPAEIVSVDSRQVYRGMDVGTDKVAPEPRARVPHHGLDVVEPSERYSAGQFARDARAWIEEIQGRGRVPLLVGGTGFFLKALIEPIFREPPLDEVRLGDLRAYLGVQPRERLAAWVHRLDPARAPLAVEGGPQRMSRTLEVALLSGRALSRWHTEAPAEAPALEGPVVVLTLAKDEMDRRIDERVARMMERGLADEVRGLLERGYVADDPGMSGTGYAELTRHLAGELTLEEAVEEIRRNTRRYARRQLTWLRHQLPDGAVHIDAALPVGEQADLALDAWRAAGGEVPAP